MNPGPMLVAALAAVCLTSARPSPAVFPQAEPGTEDEGQGPQHKKHMRKPLPSAEEIAKLPPDGGEEFNRLVFEQSPYLLQHARNPVNWYPWGIEAFRAATLQQKPVFLSVGYSTCHWCHVMEHESFESDEIAAFINDNFIPIKVDREERPDIDEVYMKVTQAMTGRGGWPNTVFLTPEKRPFFAGTYFPPRGRYGRPGVVELCEWVKEIWKSQRDEVLEHAVKVTETIAQNAAGTPGEDLTPETLKLAYFQLKGSFDKTHKGFGKAPKFPIPHHLRFLLTHHSRTGDAEALSMVEETLRAMRHGGLWDHVGFGFHRYSTDARWFLPHFEKMLYDNALLAMAYTEAFQVTGDEFYQGVARDIFTYVLRDMTSPRGGFYSAEDADSEGEEGLFYVWTTAQLKEALGEEDGAFAIELFGATDEGNFQEEATGEKTGSNHLFLPRPLAQVAEEQGVELADLEARVEAIRQRLFELREPRIHPLKDDKILTDWNGLMIAALCKAARAFEDEAYADAAEAAATFALTTLRDQDGRLFKRARGEVAGLHSSLEDYAFLVQGLIELYETRWNPAHLEAALALTEQMIEDYQDEQEGGFYLSPESATDLLLRPKDAYDGALPSGNSVAASNLIRLARATGRSEYEELAAGTFRAFSGHVAQAPVSYTQMMVALDLAVGPTFELVVVGDPESAATREALAELGKAYLPRKVTLLRPSGDAAALSKLAPWTAEQKAADGGPTFYLCRDFTCQAPTNDWEAVRAELEGR